MLQEGKSHRTPMPSFEWNKIIASVLTAMIVAMVAGILASQIVHPHHLEKAVYLPPGAHKGEKWDPDKLNVWLFKPQEYAKGTKMTFPGLPKAQDRADVIAYLESLK